MYALIFFQKSAPNLIDLFLPLLGILLFIFALNTLYEWLKTKPWKRDSLPNEVLTDDASVSHPTETHDENNNTDSDRSQLFIDAKPLQSPM